MSTKRELYQPIDQPGYQKLLTHFSKSNKFVGRSFLPQFSFLSRQLERKSRKRTALDVAACVAEKQQNCVPSLCLCLSCSHFMIEVKK